MSTFPHPKPPKEVTPEWINDPEKGHKYWLLHHEECFTAQFKGDKTKVDEAMNTFFKYGTGPAEVLRKVQEDYLEDTGGTISGQSRALEIMLSGYKGTLK